MTHLFRLGPSSMTMRAAARKSASRSGVSVPPGFSLMVVLPLASASTGSMPRAWKLMPRSKLVAARLEAAQTSGWQQSSTCCVLSGFGLSVRRRGDTLESPWCTIGVTWEGCI